MKKVVFLLLYFLSPVLPILSIYASNPGYYGASGFVPMVLGAAAFTWLNAQLILSARPKFIESSFGLDQFYRFHSLMAVVAIAIAFAHKLLKSLVKSIFILYFGVAIGSYLYHKVIHRYFLSKRFVIELVTQESPAKWSLTLRPESGIIFPYQPG